VLLGQGLQHFFVALAAADLLPSPPVESGFVTVDSGHSQSPAFRLANVERVVPRDFHSRT
jgi:hypothetical protein